MFSRGSHFSSNKKINFFICIGGLTMNQCKGSMVALHQLWLALKPTCAFFSGSINEFGKACPCPPFRCNTLGGSSYSRELLKLTKEEDCPLLSLKLVVEL